MRLSSMADSADLAADAARGEILCRIDLRALKARRDLDADGVTRSLQGAKIYAKKQARAYNDGRW